MFTMTQNKSIPCLEASIFKNCSFLTHAFCTRQGGTSGEDYASFNMSFGQGDEESNVLQNWERLAAAFDIPLAQFLVVNQVHGDDIFVIQQQGEYFTSRAQLDYDAIVTSRTNLAIGIKTADCVPIFIVDKVQKIIAVIHAGWRGSALGISVKVIHLLQDQYGSLPQDILAAIGPAIGLCCYEVDAVTADAFAAYEDKDYFLFSVKAKEKWMLDLPEANRRQLLSCGIPVKNIEVSDLCTSCNKDLFFSHRASGGVTGRQINFMMMREASPGFLTTLNHKIYWRE